MDQIAVATVAWENMEMNTYRRTGSGPMEWSQRVEMRNRCVENGQLSLDVTPYSMYAGYW